MRHQIIVIAFVAAVLVGASLATSKATTPASGSGVLSVLAKGLPVNLKDTAGRYTITILPKGPDTLPYFTGLC